MRLALRIFALAGPLCFLLVPAESAVIDAEHTAQLTQPQATVNPSPVPVRTGVLRKRGGESAIAPLTIRTPESDDFVLKLVNMRNNAEEMLIYVHRGSSYATKVPLGTYKIRGAYGQVWYGEKSRFGTGTSYFKLVQRNGTTELFPFHRTRTPNGYRINGYVVQLVKQAGGNLETTAINPEDF